MKAPMVLGIVTLAFAATSACSDATSAPEAIETEALIASAPLSTSCPRCSAPVFA